MKVFLLNLVVLVGFLVGSNLGGFMGSLLGGIGAFVGFLYVAEKFESKRQTTGFWLRYRGAFVSFLASIACVIAGILVIGGDWGIVVGIVGGIFVGEAIADRLGWGGQSLRNQIDFRTAYLSVLASAASAEGLVSEKERRLLIASAKDMFTGLGYGDDADMVPLAESLLSNPPSAVDAGAFAAALAPEFIPSLQRDVCKVLFADGDLAASELAWLEQFQSAARLNDWGILGLFSRNLRRDTPRRTQCLAELGLGPNAPDEAIKKAYRDLAMRYHPDRQDAVAPHLRDLIAKKMSALNDAYEFLTKQAANGPLFFQDTQGRSFTPSEGSHYECKCWLCRQLLRAPAQADPPSIRCPRCHALAGLSSDPTSSS